MDSAVKPFVSLIIASLVDCTVCLPCRYIAFDFHKECSRMRWHRLQILVDMVAEIQEEFGYEAVFVL